MRTTVSDLLSKPRARAGGSGGLLGALTLVLLLATGLRAATPPELVPMPRQVAWSAEPPALLEPKGVALVLGAQASAPERHAAGLLQEFVLKRFGRDWPICREGQEPPAAQTLVVLGQPSTCGLLERLCRQPGLPAGPAAPGSDGYLLFCATNDHRLIIAIDGASARGVEYGQDTFAQMLRSAGGKLSWVRAIIHDAPAVPWRGRPQTSVGHYLRPGELDLYLRSRINFIDLRGGTYAFEPGARLDRQEIAQVVQAAHERGLIVYATVNCGVPARDYERVLGTYRELLQLGADGLWLSFDDKGPGENPVGLAQQVVELGRRHGLSAHLLAITPPKGSYQRITTEFNRKLMAVPGMDQALWFWTCPPSPQALQAARALGLKARPGWWHNWPRLSTQRAYLGVPPLSLGWSAPDDDALAAGADCLDAVMPWGGNGLGQYYVVPVIGWWGWNPRAQDSARTRHRIDSLVFGEAQADAAFQFDTGLQQLSGLLHYPRKLSDQLPFCPPRLRNAADHQAAGALVLQMRSLLEDLTRTAPGQGLLPPTELQSGYLGPMRRELDTDQAAMDLIYPEDWWPDHQRQVLDTLYAGDTAAVDRLCASVRPRVAGQLSRIQEALPSFPHLHSYVEWWRERAGLEAAGWQALLQARHQALAARVRQYSRQGVNPETMLAGLRSPPLDWGIGRWQQQNRLLATVLPSANEWFWGDWLAGLYRHKDLQAAVFAASRKAPGTPGEYAELRAVLPLSGRRDRLGLLLFAGSANKDLFSNTFSQYRWAGYRFLQVLWQDKLLWETDLGLLPDKGQWFLLRLPPLPENLNRLPLRLRVQDRKLSLNNYTIAFLGPLRLLQLPD